MVIARTVSRFEPHPIVVRRNTLVLPLRLGSSPTRSLEPHSIALRSNSLAEPHPIARAPPDRSSPTRSLEPHPIARAPPDRSSPTPQQKPPSQKGKRLAQVKMETQSTIPSKTTFLSQAWHRVIKATEETSAFSSSFSARPFLMKADMVCQDRLGTSLREPHKREGVVVVG